MTHDDHALLQRRLDIEGVDQLEARYFRAIDTRRWDEFGQGFARGASFEVPEVDRTRRGRDPIVESVSGALSNAQTGHHGERNGRQDGRWRIGNPRLDRIRVDALSDERPDVRG